MVGNTLTASAGANTVFTFSVNGTDRRLDLHPGRPARPCRRANENDLTINLSSIIQATDADATRSPPAPRPGHHGRRRHADGSAEAQTGTVDEDGVPGGIAGGIGDVAGEATVASGNVSGLFNSGADPPLTYG